MKTGMDMVQDGFDTLNTDDIVTVITGNLYMYERPKNSQFEDVVVNSLPITGDQLQQGVFNVNVHVPNLKLAIHGKPDETQPDLVRLKQITALVTERLRDVVGVDYHFSVSQTILIKDEDYTWYFNIRVNYYSVQQNFTNI